MQLWHGLPFHCAAQFAMANTVETKKQLPSDLFGLQNLGNTCFLNATLQCIVHSSHLLPLCSSDATHTADGFCFGCAIQSLVQRQRDNGSAVMAAFDIYDHLGDMYPTYRCGTQQDVQQFFLALVNFMKISGNADVSAGLHSALGIHTETKVQCSECGHQTHEDFQVPLVGKDISSCLQYSFLPELLNGNNKYSCRGCQRLTQGTRQMTIKQSPPMLVLHLLRFSYSGGTFVKNQQEVDYSSSIDIPTQAGNTQKYALKSFICHHGSTMGNGHYEAFTKIGELWYSMNDSKVFAVSTSHAMSQQPYLMFYECIDSSKTFSSTARKSSLKLQSKVPQSQELLIAEKSLTTQLAQFTHGNGSVCDDPCLKTLVSQTQKQSYHHKAISASKWEEAGVLLPSKSDTLTCLMSLKGESSEEIVSIPLPAPRQTLSTSATRESLRTLRLQWMCSNSAGCWLNDEVVNTYVALLAASAHLKVGIKVFPLSTFLLKKISDKGLSHAARWFRKVPIHSFDVWIIPVHLGLHWAISVVNFKDKVIHYSDSLSCFSGVKHLPIIMSFIEEIYKMKLGAPFVWNEWRTHLCWEFPKQGNVYDCGVFALKAAEHLVFNKMPSYKQDDVPRIRLEMLYELTNKIILPWSTHRNDPTKNGAAFFANEKAQLASIGITDGTINEPDPLDSHTQSGDDGAKPKHEFTLQQPDPCILDHKRSRSDSDVSKGISTKSTDMPTVKPSIPIHRLTSKSGKELVNPSPLQNHQKQHTQDKFECKQCGKQYKHYASIFKHSRSAHSTGLAKKITCTEHTCQFSCSYLHNLRHHLTVVHGKHMEMESKTFDDYAEFEHWKSTVEHDTGSWFVKATGTKIVSGLKVDYFYCSHSGFFREQGKGLRALKTQGSSKIDSHCTASIKLTHISRP